MKPQYQIPILRLILDGRTLRFMEVKDYFHHKKPHYRIIIVFIKGE